MQGLSVALSPLLQPGDVAGTKLVPDVKTEGFLSLLSLGLQPASPAPEKHGSEAAEVPVRAGGGASARADGQGARVRTDVADRSAQEARPQPRGDEPVEAEVEADVGVDAPVARPERASDAPAAPVSHEAAPRDARPRAVDAVDAAEDACDAHGPCTADQLRDVIAGVRDRLQAVLALLGAMPAGATLVAGQVTVVQTTTVTLSVASSALPVAEAGEGKDTGAETPDASLVSLLQQVDALLAQLQQLWPATVPALQSMTANAATPAFPVQELPQAMPLLTSIEQKMDMLARALGAALPEAGAELGWVRAMQAPQAAQGMVPLMAQDAAPAGSSAPLAGLSGALVGLDRLLQVAQKHMAARVDVPVVEGQGAGAPQIAAGLSFLTQAPDDLRLQHTLNTMLSDSGLVAQVRKVSAAVETSVSVSASGAAQPVLSQPLLQPVAAAGVPVVAPVATDGGDASFSGGGQSSSGQSGQQQGMLLTSAPAGAASAQPGSAQVAGNSSFAKTLQHLSHAPLADQVAVQMKQALDSGNSRIHIQLNPEELGKLEIRLDISADGKTGVTVIADNKDTLALLQKDAQGLARALNDAGLKADSGSLNFNLRGGQDQGQGQERKQQAASTYQKFQPADDESEWSAAVITRSYVVNLADGLNIRI